MTASWWLILGLVLGGLGAFIALLVAVTGRESLERPSLLELDTPEARDALRERDDWFRGDAA